MSYARNTHRETYDARYAEANAEHFSQPGVRWKWQEVVRYMKSVFFDPIAGDPTGTDYGNETGGLRFESSTNRFRYKGGSASDPTIMWRYFGGGDGDVNYFGTEQADNGVARWHSVTRQIQGSVATLSDQGTFVTPGLYRSTQASDSDIAFESLQVGSTQPHYRVMANGKTFWGPGGTDALDSQFERIAINEIGSNQADAKLSLPNGDTRIAAQRHLGGLGNSQGDSNYRCPVVATTLPFLRSNDQPAVGGEETIFTHNIWNNALEDGDSFTVDMFFHTRDPDAKGYLKAFTLTLNTTPNISVTLPIVAGEFAGWIKWTIIRVSSSVAIINAVGMHGGSVLIPASPGGNTAFNNAGDWDNTDYQIVIKGAITGNGVDLINDGEWDCQGGRVTYYNL